MHDMKNSLKKYIVAFLLFGIIFPAWYCKNRIRTVTIITADVSEITSSGALSGGTIENYKRSAITAKGVCWSTGENPTIADNKTTESVDSMIFKSKMTGLLPDTKYFVRAYATNNSGTF